jgi:hypothetical protein
MTKNSTINSVMAAIAVYFVGNIVFGLLFLSDPSILSSVSRSMFLAVISIVAAPLGITSGFISLLCVIFAVFVILLQKFFLKSKWVFWSSVATMLALEYAGIMALGKIGA